MNAVFFSVFEDAGNQYLSRAWMIDPGETEEKAINVGSKGQWNGEYYGSYGANPGSRNWDDARKHGFICAGGGPWYSKTLFMLEPGDRVWVNIPKTGYVGVCEVTDRPIVADEFIQPEMNLLGHYHRAAETGEDNADYFVPVKWIKAVPENQAISEVGLFGNQNSIARPKADKWQHTVERLSSIWGLKL